VKSVNSGARPAALPALSPEARRLILQMAAANPVSRARRIHGELKMLGIVVSERTVSRVLRTIPRPPSQTWKTFLKNHLVGFGQPTGRTKQIFGSGTRGRFNWPPKSHFRFRNRACQR
jgi:hypothetical protein